MKLLLIVIALGLAACAPHGGKDLPMVKASDPTWPLVPDRLSAMEMPR